MTFNQTTFSGKRGAGRVLHALARWFFTATLLVLATTSAFAGGHSKVAPDIGKAPSHGDGTVDVIIQWKVPPTPGHFQQMSAHGGQLKFNLNHINGGAYRIPAGALLWLQLHPDVAYVSPDRKNKVAFDDEIPAVMADVARTQFGFDGTGVGVAVIDSGVYNHGDLRTPGNYWASRIVYSESFVPGDSSTGDPFGHGTHVAGIIAGNGHKSASGYPRQYTGLAPNANIINLRVLDATGAGADSQIIAAIDRAIQLQSTYNIRVINLSLGRQIQETYTQDPLCQAVEAAWQAGIVVVVAAGNEGRDNSAGNNGYATVGSPANDPNVITVGSSNPNGTPGRIDDTVSSYSSKGPSLLDHVVKPDIVAPGNHIVSLESPGSYLATTFPSLSIVSTTGTNTQYLQLSGTSMATPVVAGAAALMIQQDPTLTPDAIKARMMKTAWKGYPTTSTGTASDGTLYTIEYDIFTVGAGYLDVDAALSSTDVISGGAPSPIAVYNPATGQATLQNSVSVVYGNSVIWGNSVVWGDSVVWGNSVVWGDSVIWGNSVVWGDSVIWGDSVVWGDSMVWGDSVIWGDSGDAADIVGGVI